MSDLDGRIQSELARWFESARARHLDAFLCVTVDRQPDAPPNITVTVIPHDGFTKEQIDRATAHLQGIADVLRERAQGEQANDER